MTRKIPRLRGRVTLMSVPNYLACPKADVPARRPAWYENCPSCVAGSTGKFARRSEKKIFEWSTNDERRIWQRIQEGIQPHRSFSGFSGVVLRHGSRDGSGRMGQRMGTA